MSEFMFGLIRGADSVKHHKLRDRICRAEGGYGYTYATIPGSGRQGWYSGPNHGEPFDRDLARRVLARVEIEISGLEMAREFTADLEG